MIVHTMPFMVSKKYAFAGLMVNFCVDFGRENTTFFYCKQTFIMKRERNADFFLSLCYSY